MTTLPRIACKYWDVTVSALLANGTAEAVLPGVDLTIVPPGTSPDHTTVWLHSSYSNGVASILVAGPEFTSPPVGALVVSAVGGDMWARVTDNPEVDAALVDRITLL